MKKRTKRNTLLSLILSITILLVGCTQTQNKPTKNSTASAKTTLRLGVMPSVDTLPFFIAKQQKIAQSKQIELKIEVFKSAADRDAALQAGRLDGVITDLVGLAIYHQGGLDMRVVAAPLDEFALVAKKSNYTTMNDFTGKKIAYAKTSGTAFAVQTMLAANQMTIKDIEPTDIPQVPVRLELVENEQVAAAILPEPFITIAKERGAHVVTSTSELGINPFAICFTADYLKKQPKAVIGLLDAYNEASQFIKKTDKATYLASFIQQAGFPKELEDKLVIPDYGTIQPVAKKDMQAAFDWAKQVGLLKKELHVEDAISHVYFD